jgi:hyperosmotically inducible periplasmic protein
VKSQISGSSASNNVDVSTTNGVVALAGSMPSQDAIDQVKQAAQSVNGVKHVDTSALVVSGN